MKDEMTLPPASLILHPLLSRLWLHEPNGDDIARAADELGLPSADPIDLASAYADLFLLNVPPYGTVFADSSGEMNGLAAQQAAALYEAHTYRPAELSEVGAADHLGLCLGFLAHLGKQRLDSELRDFANSFLEWAPVCCLAIEREPAAHSFYRALAVCTREALLKEFVRLTNYQLPTTNLPTTSLPITNLPILPESDTVSTQRVEPDSTGTLRSKDEIGLRDIVRFFLTPAQCGVFLSRSRLGQLAREMGLRLAIGSRFEVAEGLFGAAGEAERIDRLLVALQAEIETWAAEYRRWTEGYAHWQPSAQLWLERIMQSLRMLAEMQQIAEAVSA